VPRGGAAAAEEARPSSIGMGTPAAGKGPRALLVVRTRLWGWSAPTEGTARLGMAAAAVPQWWGRRLQLLVVVLLQLQVEQRARAPPPPLLVLRGRCLLWVTAGDCRCRCRAAAFLWGERGEKVGGVSARVVLCGDAVRTQPRATCQHP